MSALDVAMPKDSRGRKSRIGETTGDCAAVCCCCPCSVVHLFLLAVYRLPAGIWRKKKSIMRKKMKKKKKSSPGENNDRQQSAADEESCGGDEICAGDENDAVGWDSEMWGRFYGGGFWRRDDD